MPPTEYAARQPPTKKGEDPVTVLVTGFGPFLEKFPINSSWEIASHLPALIPASPENKTPIHIRVHHEAIRVAYKSVTELVPTLLPPTNPAYPPPSIILHIGLAAGRKYFAIEEGSSKDGYSKIPDVDGERFTDDALFAEYPTTLTTSFDTADVLARWKRKLGGDQVSDAVGEGKCRGPDVRISQNAGNFLCGFIYYNSLAHYFSMKKSEAGDDGVIGNGERPVVFLHVPDLSADEGKMKQGREVTVALIKALVESMRTVGFVKTKKENAVREKTNGVHTDNNFA